MNKILTVSFIALSFLPFTILSAQNSFQKPIVLKKGLNEMQIEPATSVYVKSDIDFHSNWLGIINNADTLYFQEDEHSLQTGNITSALIVFNAVVNNISIFSAIDSAQIILGGINIPAINITKSSELKSGCEEPSSISQEEWRSGMPAPEYERIFTETNNIIIHHSASVFTVKDDYTDVVRNIYYFHAVDTNGRNWSDIGYNYVVAPNGDIYEARDPADYPQDEVQGAHFCGNNTGTLGICVLGNYESQEATTESMEALTQLLAWKCEKDFLDPLGTYSHILNSNLPVIAGHRNGCATLCPGGNLYNELEVIRLNTAFKMEDCSRQFSSTNEVSGNLDIQWVGDNLKLQNNSFRPEHASICSLLGTVLFESEVEANSSVIVSLNIHQSYSLIHVQFGNSSKSILVR